LSGGVCPPSIEDTIMGLWQDLQFAVRLLIKDKWFTIVAAIALALGIGVNAAVFTLVNAVLIRGLPFDEPDRIMAVDSWDPVRSRDTGVSYLDFRDWREAAKTFSGLVAFRDGTVNVSDEGRVPERFSGAYVSANIFTVIGQRPMLGRDFAPDDDRPGAEPVVLLGSSIWKNRYGSDPAIIGRTIRVNDVPSVVIGVMPEGFRFPTNVDLWQPLSNIPGLESQKRNARSFSVFGRLAPGVSLEQARAEMLAIGQRLTEEYPDTNQNLQPRVRPFVELVNGGPIKAMFLSLLGAVGFVLLIACANVANLLLARSAHRSREIAVRVSLGAGRWRIVRQLLIESALLAVISGILGLGLGVLGVRLFDAATQDVGKPYWMEFTLDPIVFAYLAAICLGTAVLFGLAPALHIAKTDVNDVLKEGGRSGSAGMRARRWTEALVVGELALTLALLAGAGFMMRNFLNLYRMDLGVDTSRLIAMSIALPERKYPSLEQRLAFYERLDARLRNNPQIRSASVVSNLPLGGGAVRRLEIDGRPLSAGEQPPQVTMVTVNQQYFETMGLTLLRGRTFTGLDGAAGQESAIVNARFAGMHFPDEDPIGRRITLSIDLEGGAPPPGGIPVTLTATIVGIAPNVRQRVFDQVEPDAVAYLPYRMDPRAFINLLVRTDGDPQMVTPIIREEVQAIDPDLPVYNIRTMDEALARQRWPFRVFGSMFSLFAAIALLFSAVGLYAVTAYSVAQRTPEIGIRMALGARSGQVMALFLRRAFVQLAIGLALGLAAAFGVGKIFESGDLLVQTTARDPLTIGGIALVFTVVATFACLLPARRATALDPLVALRRE
jgi:putative ABC transport system permease protein